MDEDVKALYHERVRENRDELFPSDDPAAPEYGSMAEILDAFLAKRGLSLGDLFEDRPIFVCDEKISDSSVIPATLYDRLPDNGAEVLGYLSEANRTILGKKGLAFESKTRPTLLTGELQLAPLEDDDRSRRFVTVPLAWQAEVRALDPMPDHYFVRPTCLYRDGHLFQTYRYGDGFDDAGPATATERDLYMTGAYFDERDEFWVLNSVHKLLRAIQWFISCIRWGAIVSGHPVFDGVTQTEERPVTLSEQSVQGLRYDFERNIIFQRNWTGSLDAAPEWIPLFVEVTLMSRWRRGQKEADLYGLSYDTIEKLEALNMVLANRSMTTKRQKVPMKQAIVEYCRDLNIDPRKVTKVQLAKEIAKMYGFEWNNVRRTIHRLINDEHRQQR